MIKLTPGFIVGITALLFAWNLYYGALIQTAYPDTLVTLYVHPLWRTLLVVFLIVVASMSQEAALMIALAIFFYFMDIAHFIKPWSKTG